VQGPDTVMTTPEKAKLFELPYRFEGLSVQGASPTRLTAYPNPMIDVPNEVGRAIGLRSVAKLFLEGKTAIARVGLGLRPAARTVSAHVQVAIFFAGLARKVAYSPSPESLTPTAAPRSNEYSKVADVWGDATIDGVESAGMRGSDKAIFWVDEAAKLDGVESAGFDATVASRIDVELKPDEDISHTNSVDFCYPCDGPCAYDYEV